MGWMRGPVDIHQAYRRNGLLRIHQRETVVTTILQALAQPRAEMFGHHLQGRWISFSFKEHRFAVHTNDFKVIRPEPTSRQACEIDVAGDVVHRGHLEGKA
ncbi:hypothetical protein D3C76_1584630 [compost metagenome]